MKTAISIPDAVFEQADRLARKLKVSRSRVYTMAMERLLHEYEQSEITAKIDQAIQSHGQPVDPVFLRGAVEDMKKVPWSISA